MAVQYTKKKEEIPENTVNAVEFVQRVFGRQKDAELPEQPKTENTK